jgi:hypothetical protein
MEKLIPKKPKISVGDVKQCDFNTVNSKVLNSTTATFFHENAPPFNAVNSSSFNTAIGVCIEFDQQNSSRRCVAQRRKWIRAGLLADAFQNTK